jgi:epoxyqueuosine reductase QueG
VGYIAGLGTFNLNNALITEKGSAGRIGSVVTSLEIEPAQRSYRERFSYCPALVNGGCGEGIKRCPAGAITENGRNNEVCQKQMGLVGQIWKERQVIKPRYGCGKCQTGVPCEAGIPKGLLKEQSK